MFKNSIDIKTPFPKVDHSVSYLQIPRMQHLNIPLQIRVACHRRYSSLVRFNPHLMIGSATPHMELNRLAGRQVHWLPQGEEDGEPTVMTRVQTQVLSNGVAKSTVVQSSSKNVSGTSSTIHQAHISTINISGSSKWPQSV